MDMENFKYYGENGFDLTDRFISLSFGGGVNSTAILIGFYERGIRPDLITFADTGGELPHTYCHVDEVNDWCTKIGFPNIRRVRYERETLEENCSRMNALPSLAYGYKKCSLKFKVQPQDKFNNNYQPCKDVWSKGNKVVKCIGFDFGEWHRIREFESKKYDNYYPLVEWCWDRNKCVDKVKEYGFTAAKSSCFFCPAMKKHEVLNLKNQYPEYYNRAIDMEELAASGNEIRFNHECKEADAYSLDKDLGRWYMYEKKEWDSFEDAPKYPQESTVKGLGRYWAWKQLGEADDAQLKLFPDESFDLGCGCMNG